MLTAITLRHKVNRVKRCLCTCRRVTFSENSSQVVTSSVSGLHSCRLGQVSAASGFVLSRSAAVNRGYTAPSGGRLFTISAFAGAAFQFLIRNNSASPVGPCVPTPDITYGLYVVHPTRASAQTGGETGAPRRALTSVSSDGRSHLSSSKMPRRIAGDRRLQPPCQRRHYAPPGLAGVASTIGDSLSARGHAPRAPRRSSRR